MAQHTPTVREMPWTLWALGAMFSGCGAAVALFAPREMVGTYLGAGVCLAIGLPLLALPAILIVRADHAGGLLIVTRRSLLRTSVQEIPLRLIASVDIEASPGDDGDTYRVVITRSDGAVTPLRAYYSSGNHEPLARRLRELIKAPGG